MKKFAVCPWTQIAVICKIKTNISEIRKAFPPFFNWIFASVYVLQYSSFWNHKAKSYGIKTTSLRPQNYKLRPQNYKLRSQNYKLRSQNYKLRSQNYKLRPQNLQVWELKLISYNFLKRCFECTVNGSLQMVVLHVDWYNLSFDLVLCLQLRFVITSVIGPTLWTKLNSCII